MKNIICLILFFYLNVVKSQPSGGCPGSWFHGCNCSNSSVATNFCCGHDPELKTQDNKHKLLNNILGGKNFCDNTNYFLQNSTSFASIPGDWFLIWNDDFNYNKVDYSFYDSTITGSNWVKNTYDTKESVITGEQNFVSNGKLILKANYDNNPAKLNSYINDTAGYSHQTKHFDYQTGGISSKFSFPIETRYQSSIKCYPNATKTWPAFWLFGTNAAQEIDIFEVVKDDFTTNPNTSLKMTYHFKKDGNNNSTEHKEEGIHHETFTDLTSGLNQYDLIWDRWKIEWYFNSSLVHSAFKYYWQNLWTNNRIQKKYREKPMHNYSEMNSKSNSGKFMRNRHFPDPTNGATAMKLIYSFAILQDATPADVGPTKTMEMDFLKVWLRAPCSGTANVTKNNFVDSNQYAADIIQTGNVLHTVPGSTILLKGGVSAGYNFPQMDAIYAGLTEIGFHDGFSVEPGANLFAFISTCDNAWDMRFANTNQLKNEEDSLIDNTDVVHMPTNNSYNINRDGIELVYNTNTIQINSSLGEIIGMEIIDMKGAIIYSIKNSGKHSLTLEKENFVPGMYTLKIQTTSNFDVKKVWVIR